MKIHRLTALLLSLLLLFSCALAESTDDKLMATVNGEELRYSAYVTYLTQYQQLLSGAYDETDETQAAYIEDLALTTAIQDMLIEQDMRAKGCYDFDEETENWIQAQGQTAYETALTNVGETLRAELGYSDEEDMSSFALSYAKALGVTVEDYIAVYRKQRAMVNYYTVLLGDNPVTEDAIQSAYETNVAASKERFEGDAAAFETALYSGEEVWYKPDGYRSILQILLPAEGDTDEARLESVQATVDAIGERLNAGESFQTLMAEYNTDTAFDDADFLTVGYQVHRDSVVWDEKFVAAAFSERMAQPGCWSDPIVSDAGVHILYYLCDSKSGAIEMTDAIHDALSYTLYQEMCSEALSARLNELSDSAKVVLHFFLKKNIYLFRHIDFVNCFNNKIFLMMQIKKEIEEANKILKEIAEALDTEDWEHVVPHDDYLKKEIGTPQQLYDNIKLHESFNVKNALGKFTQRTQSPRKIKTIYKYVTAACILLSSLIYFTFHYWGEEKPQLTSHSLQHAYLVLDNGQHINLNQKVNLDKGGVKITNSESCANCLMQI